MHFLKKSESRASAPSWWPVDSDSSGILQSMGVTCFEGWSGGLAVVVDLEVCGVALERCFGPGRLDVSSTSLTSTWATNSEIPQKQEEAAKRRKVKRDDNMIP